MNRLCQKTPEPSAGFDGTQSRAPRLPVSLLNGLCIHLWTRSELNRLPAVGGTSHSDLTTRTNKNRRRRLRTIGWPAWSRREAGSESRFSKSVEDEDEASPSSSYSSLGADSQYSPPDWSTTWSRLIRAFSSYSADDEDGAMLRMENNMLLVPWSTQAVTMPTSAAVANCLVHLG